MSNNVLKRLCFAVGEIAKQGRRNLVIRTNKDEVFCYSIEDWTPFKMVSSVFHDIDPERAKAKGCDMMFENSRYNVLVYKPNPHLVWLSFRNCLNNAHGRDWRDYQRIKNELCGTGCDAVEIYPRDESLVDTANQFHLWVFHPDHPIEMGFHKRDVMTPEELRKEWDQCETKKNNPTFEAPEQRAFEKHHTSKDCKKIGIVWSTYITLKK